MSSSAPPDLPADIIRKVVVYAGYPIGEMRRVSRLWRDLVEDEYSKKANQPPMDELEICNAHENGLNVMVAAVKVTRQFGFVLQKLVQFGFRISEDDNDRTTQLVTARKTLFEVVLKRETNAFSAIKHFNKIVLRQMSSRAKYLPIIFKGVRASEISIIEENYTVEYSKEVINLIRRRSVTSARFIIVKTPRELKPRNFMFVVADLVDSLYIEQKKSKHPVLGNIIDWERNVVKLFSKRVSKVKIVHHGDYVLSSYSESLIEKFKGIANKVPWLEIDTVGNYSKKIESRDFVMEVTKKTVNGWSTGRCLISLKHRLRINETF